MQTESVFSFRIFQLVLRRPESRSPGLSYRMRPDLSNAIRRNAARGFLDTLEGQFYNRLDTYFVRIVFSSLTRPRRVIYCYRGKVFPPRQAEMLTATLAGRGREVGRLVTRFPDTPDFWRTSVLLRSRKPGAVHLRSGSCSCRTRVVRSGPPPSLPEGRTQGRFA